MSLHQLRAAWLEKRKAGIGGSDAPVIMGLTRKKPMELWAEKLGVVEPEDIGERENVKWGNILEPVVADEYSRRFERQLTDPGRFAIHFSSEYPWMHCTVDRIIEPAWVAQVGREQILLNSRGTLSIKCAGEYLAKDWDPEPPLWAMVQAQHECIVHDFAMSSIAVLIGGNRLQKFDIPRNERFCRVLIEKEEIFWDMVTKQEPPLADGSDSTREILKKLYPKDTGESVVLPIEAWEWAAQLRAAKDAEAAAKATKDEMQNKLAYHIQNATVALLPELSPEELLAAPQAIQDAIRFLPANMVGFTYKSQHRDGYTVEPCDFRVLREQKTKSIRRR